MLIDLRSDTVTRPTPAMLQAMMQAPTGDDVFGEDPTVNELENMAATMFGKEAALYCPSGTMSNQIAIKVHTQPGDEVICDFSAHVYQFEGGGIAFNSGAQVALLQGDRGRFTASQVSAAINNRNDVHKANTSLVCIENTSNRGGGSCYNMEEIKKIREVCDNNQLNLHLDGARLFNAMVANNESPVQYGELFHTISICLNKGLGCPIGSILLGSKEFIRKSRRIRKVFGGGMRQAGIMAASGIYALHHNISRLAEDHDHAKTIAAALAKKEFTASILPVETNIIIFEVSAPYQPSTVTARLKENNILAIPFSPTQIRMVLHLDITPEMVKEVVKVIENM
ncbi:MAG: GntG family PLP-dependent aldolase [Chitinophagaceae bacterium]